MAGAPRRILTLGGAGIAGQALTIATLPVLTRLYDPASFAVWTAIVSVSLLFTGIAALRYELAIVLPDSGEEASNLLVLALGASAGMALVAGLLQAVFATALVGEAFEADLLAWSWFVPSMVVVTGTVQALLAWCTRMREFGWYAIGQAGAPSATIAAQMAAYLAGATGAGGLLLGTLGGQIVVALVLAVLVGRRYAAPIGAATTTRRALAAARAYRQYPLFVTPYTLTGTVRERAAHLLMTAFAERSQLGFFGLATRFVNMPNSLFSNALRPVFFQRAARSDFRSLEGFVTRILRVLILVVVPGWAAFLAFPATVFEVGFGPEWAEAGRYAAVLSFPAFVLMITNWLDRAFDVLGRQRLVLGFEVAFSALGLAALLGGIYWTGDMFRAIVLQSAALTVCYLGWLYVVYRIGGFGQQALASVILTLAASLAACSLLLAGLRWALPAPAAVIVYGLVAGGGAAIGMAGDLRWLMREGKES